jgi:hypothetical protein
MSYMLERMVREQPVMETLGLVLEEKDVPQKPDITAIVASEYPKYQAAEKKKHIVLDSIYKAFTPVYDYISKKAKDSYQTVAEAVKKTAKDIRIKTENGLRVLLRGWVRTYSVSKDIKITKTPYGKPCDPTREAFYSEFMSVLS